MSLVNLAAAQLLRILPRERISRAVGRLCEQPLPSLLSSAVSRAYAHAYGVDMAEAAAPHGCYRSFDAFFTRTLREGARPVANAPVVSPSDGVVSSAGLIDDGARMFVKARPYEVGELLGDPNLARDYVGGQYLVIYLSPRDYHRVHCPVDGSLLSVIATPGDCFPVNSLGERAVPQLYVRNRRVTFLIETDERRRIALVMVGAFIVGKIGINALGERELTEGQHRFDPAIRLNRGDEIGAFHLGSTVVLLAGAGVSLDAKEGKIRCGESLTRRRA